MKDIIEAMIAIIYSVTLFMGAGYGIKQFHDEMKKAALEQVEKGLSSSEELANALTGESTGF